MTISQNQIKLVGNEFNKIENDETCTKSVKNGNFNRRNQKI